MSNTLKPAETYTHTHTGKSLNGQKQIGTICFSKFFRIFIAPIFAIFCGMFCHIESAHAVDYYFTVNTSNIAANGTFQFKISAKGTFYVDCGTGGTLSRVFGGSVTISGGTIKKTGSVTITTFKCTYSTAGTKTIRFGGLATAYNTSSTTAAISFYVSDANAALITSISGNLSTIFPNNGTSLGSHPVFYQLFNQAVNLTSIPATLFSGYTSGGSYMFYQTFRNCTGLTSIPETLFNFGGNNVSGQDYMFSSTFSGCTSLTSIPANLFQRVTGGAQYMFSSTFYGCTNITGYIPPSTFAGLIANGHPTASYMWSSTFNNTQLVTTCPTGTAQYITGYEGTGSNSWNRKVSCGTPVTCSSGYYLPANSASSSSCTSCPSGYVCPGGNFAANAPSAQGVFEYLVTYSCGSGTGTPPASVGVNSGDLFTPAASTCTAPTGYIGFTGWLVSGTSDVKQAGTAFTWNYTSNKTLTAQWMARNIGLTFDGDASPSSCTYGSTFVPPTPAARTGYVFVGWKVKETHEINNCGIPDLDSSINGTAYGYANLDGSTGSNESKYGLTVGSGQWAVETSYGVVYGMANCNNVEPNDYVCGWIINNSLVPESSGKNCWCQATGFTPTASSYTSGPSCIVTPSSSAWVWECNASMFYSESMCSQYCANFCADYYSTNSSGTRGTIIRAAWQ